MEAAIQLGDLVASKYRVERMIGKGGMAVIFAATHLALEQQVALKVLNPDAAKSAEIRERFAREARAAAKIQSEHVARVLDIAVLDSGEPYIVMEYLDGDDLEHIVKEGGPLQVEEAIRHVLAASEALAEVHGQGMVHRDVKPANLFLANRPDGSRQVKLLDFGISKVGAPVEGPPAWNPALTATSTVMGTPRYMSPEQLRASRDVDARSDIWALGVTLYELLSGVRPFAGGTMPEVCASILKDPPTPFALSQPSVAPALERVVFRCLEKEAVDRFTDLADLAAALAPFGAPEAAASAERVAAVLARAAESRLEQPASPPSSGAYAVVARATPDQVPTVAPPAKSRATPSPMSARSVEILERLGDRTRVLRVSVDRDSLQAMAIGARDAFLLSRVDGAASIDEVMDTSGMPMEEALEVLDGLLAQRLVVIDTSPMPR